MSSGSKKTVSGYKYKLGVQLGLCHGPVDSINKIIVGEREAWSGTAEDNQTISVNAPELFGGDKREGGVVGDVDVCMGSKTQPRNTYLTTFQGATSPAYRGLCALVFKAFQWASGNPYFKAPWVEVRRILGGWGGESSVTGTEYTTHALFPWVEDGDDPRACQNDHEYQWVSPPGEDAAPIRDNLEDALADAEAFYGDPPVYYAGWSSDSTNLHGFGSTVEAGERLDLTLQYLFETPVMIYPETEISDGAPPCANLSHLLSLGAPVDTPILWGGRANQNTSIAGMYWISLNSLPTSNPGLWILANNCDLEDDGFYSARRCVSVYIRVRRVQREPDDPCAPRCTDPYPDYTEDPTYCVIGSTAVKKNSWTPTSGTFKALSFYHTVTTTVAKYPLPPVLRDDHPDYNNEDFWTAAYDSAVLAGTIPAGLTYNAAGTGGLLYFPHVATGSTYVFERSGGTITDGGAWEPSLAAIGIDMNPAHIIYQCMTNNEWGMGYSTDDMGPSFEIAAQQLYDEGFGLSLMWDQESNIEDFVQLILNHISGNLGLNMQTGKFELKLVRDDVDVEELPVLTPSNTVLKAFQRGAYGDAANQLTVTYTNRNEDEKSVTVQNLAAIAAQMAIVPTTRQYRGIREPALAARVAMRDLATCTSNLAKISATTDRVLWNKNVGDAVAVTWPAPINVTAGVFRIVSIDMGNHIDGKIDVELVEDVFGLPDAAYTETPDSEWEDPVSDPAPVEAARAIETPYWEVAINLSAADIEALGDDYGFGSLLAARGVDEHPINYKLMYSAAETGTYTYRNVGQFNPTGILTAALSRTATTFTLENFYDLDQAPLDGEDNGYAWINDEAVAVVSVNTSTGVVVVRRGCLDTVPQLHADGDRVYFSVPVGGYDPTERVDGETAYYKPLPTTGIGTLDEGDATAVSLEFVNRAYRPYPPGKFRINTLPWPTTITDAPLTISWTHRDRLAQTVTLVDESQGSIGPEAGTTYTIRLTDDDTDTVLQTVTGITGTSQLFTFTFLGNLKVELWSVRGGLTSVQIHEHTFYYDNIVERVTTTSGDFRVTSSGDTRVLR